MRAREEGAEEAHTSVLLTNTHQHWSHNPSKPQGGLGNPEEHTKCLLSIKDLFLQLSLYPGSCPESSLFNGLSSRINGIDLSKRELIERLFTVGSWNTCRGPERNSSCGLQRGQFWKQYISVTKCPEPVSVNLFLRSSIHGNQMISFREKWEPK